ncbi:hypothetical protein B0H14DRAFT_2570550 [Mycena olivaceomarginata]|nr:hypothetical protein B0H14DRAFT_2570550 [Mycena olivaceomarginata]
MSNLRDPSASGWGLSGANIEAAQGLTMIQGLRYSSDVGTRQRRSRISVHFVDQQRARPSSTSSGDLLGPFPADLHLPSTSSLGALQSDLMMRHIHSSTFFTAANVNFFGTKEHRLEEMNVFLSAQPVRKRQQLENCYRIKVCKVHFTDTMSTELLQIFRSKNVNLIHEIRSSPGYFLHTGQNKGRVVIFKIFNPGPTV